MRQSAQKVHVFFGNRIDRRLAKGIYANIITFGQLYKLLLSCAIVPLSALEVRIGVEVAGDGTRPSAGRTLGSSEQIEVATTIFPIGVCGSERIGR
jgi:hypothetical protein